MKGKQPVCQYVKDTALNNVNKCVS